MPSDITGTDILQDDPETGRRKFVFLPGPALRQHDPGRRDQPHAAQDAGGPARGDAGAPRHRRRRRRTSCPSRSSCWRRRTRSSRRAPTRCPRRSSTASCSTSRSATRAGRRRSQIMKATTGNAEAGARAGARRRADPAACRRWCGRWSSPTTSSPTPPTWCGRRGRRSRACRSSCRSWSRWGAGPRASQYLILGGKARAILHGRLHVTTEDIRAVAHPVLRHRLDDDVQRRRRGDHDRRHHPAS